MTAAAGEIAKVNKKSSLGWKHLNAVFGLALPLLISPEVVTLSHSIVTIPVLSVLWR